MVNPEKFNSSRMFSRDKQGKTGCLSCVSTVSPRSLVFTAVVLSIGVLQILRNHQGARTTSDNRIRETTPQRSFCVEVISYDRREYRESATKSINYPQTLCDTLLLSRKTTAETWRRATWTKVDVLSQYPGKLENYRYIVTRDIDTKVNTTHVLKLLQAKPSKTFAIGYRHENSETETDFVECSKATAVTNWFAFDRKRDSLHKLWKNIKIRDRYNTDQQVLNDLYTPCCRDDVLCIDKCDEKINEVHCRRAQGSNLAPHYGSQIDCILSRKERNPEWYDSKGIYSCKKSVTLTYFKAEKDK